MAEMAISLLEFNRRIGRLMQNADVQRCWVVAETSDVRQSGGHCYLELIEKGAQSGTIVAKARAMIWASRWSVLHGEFEAETGQSLQPGLKVMVRVQVQMHEAYGYSLVIQGIDSSFTLGEMQKRRQEIIRQLTADGIIDANKELVLPRPTQRIAIISAGNAAGYGDFCHQLDHNGYGLVFYTHLFPAVMQGDRTESSVIHALDCICAHQDDFDAVVIIRGGGATSDLSSFDSYELAFNVANFPLPVITGIGHERDLTVLDVVAHTSVKTPTAVAAFLIDRMAEELAVISDFRQDIVSIIQSRITREQLVLDRTVSALRTTRINLERQQDRLQMAVSRVRLSVRQRLAAEQQRLTYMQHSVKVSQPDLILQRGFSITRLNGHAVRRAEAVNKGDVVETQTAEGTFRSVVE